MSIRTELLDKFPDDIVDVRVNKSADLHGEVATEITVQFKNNVLLTGTFTDNPRSSFGGVQFSGPKDIVGLMTAKIESVLRGTAWLGG